MADASRHTEVLLLRALDAADQYHIAPQPLFRQRLNTVMREIGACEAGSATLAHMQRAFLHVQQGGAGREQAWQTYREGLLDAAAEYDHRAARIHRITEVVTGLAFLAATLCLALSYRRFGEDRYANACLAHENKFLRHSEKRFRTLVQNASEVVAILVEDGTAVYLSPAVRRMWGYAPESLIGKRLSDLVSPEDQANFQEVFRQARARAGKIFTCEATVSCHNGAGCCCQVVMLNLLAEPDVFGIVVTLRDITLLKQGEEALRQAKASLEVRVAARTADLEKANDELQTEICERRALEEERERLLTEALERADHDPLTGLLNHRAFHKRFQEEADRALRQNSPLAIAVLDLDNFKFFNDAYGHLVGDEVLREVACLLKSCCRSYDTLARFGGDEFALLMPGTSMSEAPSLAERLRLRLADAMYQPPNSDTAIPLSLSMGLAVFPEDEPSRLDALELADARLLRAKTGAEDTDIAFLLRKTLNDSVAGFSMLDALVTAVNNKDRYTRRHSEDVMIYSLQIACEMGLDEAAQETLATAALLHDVGKIGVPDFVLRKPSALTEEEIEIIKHHPVMGAVIVAAVPGLEGTLDAVRHHHERWDGMGYPGGLTGLAIPFAARLMAVADAFSAMTTDRPYRKGHEEAKALRFLAEGAGTQWEPDCVSAFLRARQKIHPAAYEGKGLTEAASAGRFEG